MLVQKKLYILYAILYFAAAYPVLASAVTAEPKPEPAAQTNPPAVPDKNLQKPPESTPDYARLRDTVRRYKSKITQLEKKKGAYSDRVGEESIGLGLAYRDLGEYQHALTAFDRALHISRVNHGPDNPRQLPILDRIIETNTALADWKALNENYQLLYWISRRAYKDDISSLLKIIYRIASWHLNAYLASLDPIPYQHLLESEKLFHDAVNIIEKGYGKNDPRLIKALNGIAITNYYISSRIYNANTSEEMQEIHSSSVKMSQADNIPSDLIWNPLRYSRSETRKVFNRIAKIYNSHPDLPVEDRATALVNIGDWYLIYGWRNHALKNYRQAYRLLAHAGAHQRLIDKLFREPARIPTITVDYPGTARNVDIKKEKSYVRISFKVNDLGCAEEIKFIGQSDPKKFMARVYAKKLLQASLFRPEFDGIKPITDPQVVLRLSGAALTQDSDRRIVNYEAYPGFIATRRCGHLMVSSDLR